MKEEVRMKTRRRSRRTRLTPRTRRTKKYFKKKSYGEAHIRQE
jgi:hypothetical protein